MRGMDVAIIREHLRSLDPIEGVSGYEVETRLDSTGEDAVWIFVVTDDARLDDLWPVWPDLREQIRGAVARAVGADPNVYVRMWSATELREQRQATA